MLEVLVHVWQVTLLWWGWMVEDHSTHGCAEEKEGPEVPQILMSENIAGPHFVYMYAYKHLYAVGGQRTTSEPFLRYNLLCLFVCFWQALWQPGACLVGCIPWPESPKDSPVSISLTPGFWICASMAGTLLSHLPTLGPVFKVLPANSITKCLIQGPLWNILGPKYKIKYTPWLGYNMPL